MAKLRTASNTASVNQLRYLQTARIFTHARTHARMHARTHTALNGCVCVCQSLQFVNILADQLMLYLRLFLIWPFIYANLL